MLINTNPLDRCLPIYMQWSCSHSGSHHIVIIEIVCQIIKFLTQLCGGSNQSGSHGINQRWRWLLVGLWDKVRRDWSNVGASQLQDDDTDDCVIIPGEQLWVGLSQNWSIFQGRF